MSEEENIYQNVFEDGHTFGPLPDTAFGDRIQQAIMPIITMADNRADIPSMLAQSAAVQAFHAKLSRAYPGVVLKKFIMMIVVFAVGTGFMIGADGLMMTAAHVIHAAVEKGGRRLSPDGSFYDHQELYVLDVT